MDKKFQKIFIKNKILTPKFIKYSIDESYRELDLKNKKKIGYPKL